MRGDLKKTELSSGGQAPCSTGFPPLGECSRNPSVSVHQLGCCERLHSASVSFFEDSFNMFAHFMMGDLRAHLPAPC